MRTDLSVRAFLWLLSVAVLGVVAGCSPTLHEAASSGNTKAAIRLLDKGADVNVLDDTGTSPLHYAPHADMAELLISRGASVSATNKSGATPLHIAAETGRIDVVKVLIAKGADVNAKDENGDTPWLYAVAGPSVSVRQFLEEHAATPLVARKVRLRKNMTLDEARDEVDSLPLFFVPEGFENWSFEGGGWVFSYGRLIKWPPVYDDMYMLGNQGRRVGIVGRPDWCAVAP